MWSIGAILYLCITGGVTDKRHEEYFDFREQVWYNVSEELKDFMLRMLIEDPKKRSSIRDLLKTDFIRMAQGYNSEGLDETPLEDTNLTD